MARLILIMTICFGAAGALGKLVAQDSDAEQHETKIAAMLRYLEQKPEQSFLVPRNLEELVGFSQAAVVARIEGFGDLTSINDEGSRGEAIATDVFASYRVLIAEVVFNRKSEAPPLTVGEITTITQMVGKRDAELFLSRRFPPLDRREYLFFLWLRPGADSWSMLQWPLQFRRSASAPDTAEVAAKLPDGRSLLAAQWLGGSVQLTSTGDKVVPAWGALVSEVKRLAAVVPR
jgi:hypothetical protein